MAFQLFTVPIQDDGRGLEQLNAFLRSHKILSVDRRWVEQGASWQPATWRLLLIKVAATMIVSSRRILVRLSGSWPHRHFFEQIGQHVSSRPARPACWTG